MGNEVILVVAAHPDDEVLGCGGTIKRLSELGYAVCVGIMGEGITSRCGSRDMAKPDLINNLKHCSRQAAGLLGVTELLFHGLPDNRFDTVPLLEIIRIVEDLIERFQPRTIYTHHGGDLNVDHSILHRAVLTATRPIAGHPVKEVYAFEVPSSTEYAFGGSLPAFRPSVFVDIRETIGVKLEAMEVYHTEKRPYPHPRSMEALRAIAQRWGTAVGLEYAEAFELIRSVRVAPLMA